MSGTCDLAGAWFLIVQLVLHAETARPAPALIEPLLGDAVKSVPVEAAYFWSVWVGAAVSIAAVAVLLPIVARPIPR